MDKAKSYNYVTRALANVKEKNVRDQKVFKVNRRANRECCLMLKLKVLLAVRRMIKAASFAFFWQMMEKHTHNQLFRYMMDVWNIATDVMITILVECNFFRHCGHPHKFDVARQRFFSQKMSQFKALSAMILAAEEYNCLDNHDAFCCEVWRNGGAVDVAESLEKMRNEVKKVYLIVLNHLKGSLQNKFSVKVGNLAQPAGPPPPRTLGFQKKRKKCLFCISGYPKHCIYFS